MTTSKGVIRLEPNGPEGVGLIPMDLDSADFQSDLPEQNVHVYFTDPDIGMTVGVWTTTDMQEAFGPYPGDEFMLVLEGQVAMVDGDGGETLVKQGEFFLIRNAIPISWRQVGFLRKFYITLLDPKAPTPDIASAEGGVIVMDPGSMAKAMAPSDESIGGGQQHETTAFTNDAGTMSVGMWQTTAFESAMQPFSVHEFCQVLEGAVTITEAGGVSHRFTTGDVFFVPKGTECSWTSDGPFRKYFACVDPAADG